MSGWRRLLAIGALAVLVACGGGDTSATVPTTSSEEPTTEPPLEPTGPESTQPFKKKPSIEIANGPIGGNGGEGPRACVDVNWLATNPIPDGTTIKLGAIHLEPGGVFELDQGSCAGDQGSCTGLDWTGKPPACFVGVKQVAAADPSQTVLVILPVTVTCERQADCDRVAADAEANGGSSVGITPDPGFGTSESPSESPSEAPSESPSDG